MVDFRYHLVSIVAVFLALAIGIVVGTTALNGRVLDNLRSSQANLIKDKRALEGDVRTLQNQMAAEQQAARIVAPVVVSGRLTGERIVLVSTPDAPARLRDDLVPLLTAAGAVVSSSVRLRPTLLGGASDEQVTAVVDRAALPGQALPQGQPVDRAMAQLASVLVRRPGSAAPSLTAVSRVLSAYADAGMLDLAGDPAEPAAEAVLLTAGPASSGSSDAASAAAVRDELGLARQLDARSGGAVVAGPAASADAGGLVRALRDDPAASDQVSSVDSVDTPTGRTAVVLALQEQLRGRAGRYGSATGADAPLPDPTK